MQARMRKLIKVAALAATASMAFAAPASIADGGEKTRIEITKLTANSIQGTIESSKDSCVQGRHVQIFRYDGFLSVKVGRLDAKPDGDWKLTKPLQAARYFAKVDSKPGCRYDVSREKRLQKPVPGSGGAAAAPPE